MKVPRVEVSRINSWHQLKAQLVGEGSASIVRENGRPKLPLEIPNEEIAGLGKEFCIKEKKLADEKQVKSFIIMPTYRDQSRHSVMATQFTGLKVSFILTTYPERYGLLIVSRALSFSKTFDVALSRRTREKSDRLGDVNKFTGEHLKRDN